MHCDLNYRSDPRFLKRTRVLNDIMMVIYEIAERWLLIESLDGMEYNETLKMCKLT